MNPGDDLLPLEARMRAPDAIMEPGMADAVASYIRAGGKPEDVIESLTSGYDGAAQMASLVCGWIRLVDAPYAPPGAGEGAFGVGGDAAATKASTAAAAGASQQQQQQPPPDEFALLQELARARFQADPLLAVFRRGRPTWLNELLADARGRRLILDLSAEHRSSIFLNYAMRRIFDMGHDDEVAAVGPTLASYFEVFHRLLARALERAAAAGTPAALAKASAELAEMAAPSQHTYAHAQCLLADLCAGPHGAAGPYRRLSQELEAAAALRHGGARVWAMRPLFVPRSAPALEREAARLVSRALVLGATGGGGAGGGGGGGGGGDQADGGAGGSGGGALTQVAQLLAQLQELYARPEPPSLDTLRHPRLLQMLLEGLFSWQQTPSATVQRLAAYLLAVAAAAGPNSGSSLDGSLDAQNARQLTPDEAQAHLQTARDVAARAAGGARPDAAELGALAAATRALPLAAAGTLHLAAGVLGSAAAYDDERCAAIVPALLAVLRCVADAQASCAADAVAALCGALEAMGARQMALADLAATALADLALLPGGGVVDGSGGAAAAHNALTVLAAAERWAARGAEPSIVRCFVLRVLERAGPPYSRDFARSLLRLTAASSMAVAMRAGTLHAMPGAIERLREFAIESLDGVDFVPPLTDAEIDLLQQLAAFV